VPLIIRRVGCVSCACCGPLWQCCVSTGSPACAWLRLPRRWLTDALLERRRRPGLHVLHSKRRCRATAAVAGRRTGRAERCLGPGHRRDGSPDPRGGAAPAATCAARGRCCEHSRWRTPHGEGVPPKSGAATREAGGGRYRRGGRREPDRLRAISTLAVDPQSVDRSSFLPPSGSGQILVSTIGRHAAKTTPRGGLSSGA
jgi:hypothetical protein